MGLFFFFLWWNSYNELALNLTSLSQRAYCTIFKLKGIKVKSPILQAVARKIK